MRAEASRWGCQTSWCRHGRWYRDPWRAVRPWLLLGRPFRGASFVVLVSQSFFVLVDVECETLSIDSQINKSTIDPIDIVCLRVLEYGRM